MCPSLCSGFRSASSPSQALRASSPKGRANGGLWPAGAESRPLSFTSFSSSGLRHPASASCLGRHSRLAGRCPNNSSLFRPQAAVVVVAPKGRAYGGSRSGPSFVQPLRLALLASSPSRGAFGKEVSSQRNGELAGLSATPEPPLLGEVALRSNDGEVGQSRALSGICVASPFERLPPAGGRCRVSDRGRTRWQRVSADGEGEAADPGERMRD